MRAIRTGLLLLATSTALFACRAAPAIVAPPRLAAVAAVSGEAPVSDGTRAPAAAHEEADGAEDGADDDASRMVLPCADGPERKAAQAAIEALGTRIDALGDTDSPKQPKAELDDLLATQCFLLSADDPHDALDFDSGLALRTWWGDGGRDWVEHYLALDAQRVVIIPPSPRKTFKSVVGPKHPLAAMLCPASDASCGRETTGWARRVTRGFELRANAREASFTATSESCEKEAKADKSIAKRYETFRRCLDNGTPRRQALPLGTLKSASDGWIVFGSNRRCGELRAYDLATGAAYIVTERCARSSTTPPIQVKSGRVSIAALREAAWMMMIGPMAERGVRVETTRYDVPAEIVIGQPEIMGRSFSVSCGGCGVRTTHNWSWMRERGGTWKGQTSGVLHTGSACDDASDEAGELLSIVDDSFEEGCAPAPPPAQIAWSEPGEPSASGRPKATLDDPDRAPLRVELAKAKPKAGVATCAKAP